MTKFLLSQSECLIEESDKNGRRAIHLAAYMGYDNIVEILLQKQVEVDAKVRINKCFSIVIILYFIPL